MALRVRENPTTIQEGDQPKILGRVGNVHPFGCIYSIQKILFLKMHQPDSGGFEKTVSPSIRLKNFFYFIFKNYLIINYHKIVYSFQHIYCFFYFLFLFYTNVHTNSTALCFILHTFAFSPTKLFT